MKAFFLIIVGYPLARGLLFRAGMSHCLPRRDRLPSRSNRCSRKCSTAMPRHDCLSRPFCLKQASSHDRQKNDPANPTTWHSNTDYGQFIRTETNEGRREWVIMEDQGPGAIVRFWTPLLAEKDQQIIRFYFDGSPTPAIVAKLNDLLCGKAFVRPPLAFMAWNESDLADQLKPDFKARRGVAGDLYLPIPFAKRCKITLDSVPFYYVINYRIYEPGTKVQTFSMAGL